jgi:CHAT domain-containing protein/Flp pilus assembly protein TadD
MLRVVRQRWLIVFLVLFVLCALALNIARAQQQSSPQSPSALGDLIEALGIDQQVDKLRREGHYVEAIPLAFRALALREKALGTEHPDTVESLNQLAILYCETGNYARAEPLCQRVWAIREKVLGAEHPDTARALNSLAALHLAKADFEQAEPLLRRVVTIFEKTLGAERPDTAVSLSLLAQLYRAKGDYARAEMLYQRVWAIREKVLGAEHPDTARALNELAVLYYGRGDPSRGDYALAESLWLRALTIIEKTLGAEHLFAAGTLGNLAMLYYSRNDYERAEPLLLRVVMIYGKSLGAEHPDMAILLNNLATLCFSKGDYERAEPLLRRVATMLEKSLGTEHPLTASSLNNLGALYEAKGDYERAEPLLRRAAEIQERNLTQILLTGSEQQKQLYLNMLTGNTYGFVSFSTHAMPMNERASRLALAVILQRKGRALDAMTEQIGILRRRANPQDRDLLDQLLATHTQLATLQVNENITLSPEQQRALIAQLETEAEKLEATISGRSAEFRAQIQPITLAGVQQALPSDAALIEFFAYRPLDAKAKPDERFGKPHYVAYALKREGTPKFVDLGEAEAIDRAVAAWREALRDEGRADVTRLARALDELVMRPVRGLVGETRRLLISPDGALNLIPFAALVDEQNEYLVKNYAISYLTSGRDLLRLQVARESKQAPLVVADPDFNALASGQAAARRGQGTKKPSSGAQSSPPSGAPPSSLAQFQLDRLPNTATEARALKALLPEAVVLTGKQATEAALKQATAPRLLHIATHGFFLEDLPTPPPAMNRGVGVKTSLGLAMNPAPSSSGGNPLLRSGLALTGFNLHRGGEDDGVLTALEATGLNLWGTQMVILSACETGVGAVKNGQGVYGLRRALVLAGAGDAGDEPVESERRGDGRVDERILPRLATRRRARGRLAAGPTAVAEGRATEPSVLLGELHSIG